ncbi:bifunctional diaminohydroxyphosphoribosylaminopyrimidine deaminase/5-amino-6-(5-phosphoribosylamino)uracil reductase RibD [Clostridium sp. 'White wine YQ']|uniref:bifunctional diaminohydroxyphosphoribosylaminopyrimidine deaminase/5-amino-6-(5-phosphoribosylamino)uracil reductase RibD n=1 Tax=Clostridium sp. 'White wine YQ' TaxID=3027474 RepID=UPI002365E64D|nr:bifunctional diaminohydroxyphosphoribosylaminopyrimidine deaminase/5-amino-6-(5-phosphoribosylamino)uracil reductase RibD [Clostridium sp. 'White wine YQ']MDD7795222.1 bifunctional diaminohydroxyphosphoribosylaminopyrimidine deaminase/5-amino-6-(5-phosphoribosylamino)uracil reductase RibD [Clostridium sp. 'White wine YQ']
MDVFYMRKALELARKGVGKVNPNPLVGAIIVKDNKIIGQGYHEFYGGPHAEVNALSSAVESVEGSTVYVTLEPCHHYGKTPPCVDALIKNKVAKVVIGQKDPNPLVAGKSINKLLEHGIEVEVGILEEECKKLNEVFNKFIVTKKPFVVLKSAISLDGKIATHTGESKWITGEEAREEVQELRNSLSGIMVGVDTVIMDNPLLTCRMANGRNPKRIIVDSRLRIPLDSKVLVVNEDSNCIIATTQKAPKEKVDILRNKGIEVIILPEKDGKVNLKDLVVELGKKNIDGILLEGGGTLNFSALKEGIVDKVQYYISPKIIGGRDAKTSVEGEGVNKIEECFRLNKVTTRIVGEDILVEGYI